MGRFPISVGRHYGLHSGVKKARQAALMAPVFEVFVVSKTKAGETLKKSSKSPSNSIDHANSRG
jgi:hypothetical protein